MKVVLAFDSYKGALSARDACAAAAVGISRDSVSCDVVHCPLSDGGEGFAEAMRMAGNGEERLVRVAGPLFANTTGAFVLLDVGKTAVIESAQACGLELVPPEQRSPIHTTTFGLGETILAAVDAGAEHLVIGLGGSATNDAGLGMLTALGWVFLDANGQPVRPVGGALSQVASIIPGNSLAGVRITAACDVTNPLYGPQGAAYAYAPQKGASTADVEMLDTGLRHFAGIYATTLGVDYAVQPGAGAAGGLGFALQAFLGAEFRPGATLAIELSRLASHLVDADLCLTGEGRTDFQTAFGKLPAAVAACCAQAGVPCVCLSGALGEGWRTLYDHGFTAIHSIAPGPQTLAQAIGATAESLADTAEAVTRLFTAAQHTG